MCSVFVQFTWPKLNTTAKPASYEGINMSSLTRSSSLFIWLSLVCVTQTLFSQETYAKNISDDNNSEAQVITYEEGELEQLISPIALYPDTLLSHILIASTYPLEIIEAYRFIDQSDELSTQELELKAKERNWDPSVAALLPFKTVLKRLHDDLIWTQQLGNAFLDNEKGVLASIQALRKQADDAGNLSSIENMDVNYEQNKIVIQSSSPNVIYVPYYDTQVVYGYWPWHYYPPVRWHYPKHYYSYYSPFYWGTGVAISTRFYFSTFHWHRHYVAVDYHYYSNRYHHNYRKGRKRHSVIKSGYANKWHHKPKHRRNVAYKTGKTKTKHYEGYKHKSHHNLNKKRVLSGTKYHKQPVKRSGVLVNKSKPVSKKHYANTLNKVKATHSSPQKSVRSVVDPTKRTTKVREFKREKPQTSSKPIKQIHKTNYASTQSAEKNYTSQRKSYSDNKKSKQQRSNKAISISKGASRSLASNTRKTSQKRK